MATQWGQDIGGKTIGVFDNFALNLRRLTKQRGSIVRVCDELGINRQQYSKYLSGETFPRRKTFEQISAYFGINEADFFLNPDDRLVSFDAQEAVLMGDPVFRDVLKELHKPQDMPLDDGFYMTYMRATQEQDWIIRSVTVIKTVGDTTQFRRLTGWAESRSSLWRLSLGNHRGLVLNRRGVLYFGALDAFASKAPSLAIMQWTPTKVPLLKGRCVALTKSGGDICDIVMELMPKGTTLRDAIRQSGAIGAREATVPTHIRQILANM